MSDSDNTPDSVNYINKLGIAAAAVVVIAAMLFWLTTTRPPIDLQFDRILGTESIRQVENRATGERYTVHTELSESRYPASQIHDLWLENVCVVRGCLRLDGYARFIELPDQDVPDLSLGFTLRLWVAARASSLTEGEETTLVSGYDETSKTAVELFISGPSSWGVRVSRKGQRQQVLATEATLRSDLWTHLAVSYDPMNNTVHLYQNGAQTLSQEVEPDFFPAQLNSPWAIGRNVLPENRDGLFTRQSFAGLLDNLQWFDHPLDAEDIQSLDKDERSESSQNLSEPVELPVKTLFSSLSRLNRPQFHAGAMTGWTDKPVAAFHYKDQYHLFFLVNPDKPFPGRFHWGHLVSDDLVNWRELPLALSPDATTPHGLGAGSVLFDAQGTPSILFTIPQDERKLVQIGLARPVDPTDPDLREWKIERTDALVQGEEAGYPGQFADPFVIQDSERQHWYALVGSQTSTRNGAVLLYRSDNARQWAYQGEFFTVDRAKFSQVGTEWSSPVLLPLGSGSKGRTKYILLVKTEGLFKTTASYYWLGYWQGDRFVADSPEPRRLEIGHAKSNGMMGMVDQKTGRSILFQHADDEQTPQQRFMSGHAHNFGLPLHLSLTTEKKLAVAPLSEIDNLRGEQLLDMKDITFAELRAELTSIRAEAFDLEMVIDRESKESVDTSRTGIIFHQSADNQERVVVSWDNARRLLIVQRSQSTLDPDIMARNNVGDYLESMAKEFQVRLLVDRSQIEGYFDDQHLFLGRVYPVDESSNRISLIGSNNIRLKSFRLWRMKSLADRQQAPDVPAAVIPAEKWVWTSQLPNHDFSSTNLEGWQVVSGQAFVDQAVTPRSHYKNELTATFNVSRRIPGLHHYWGELADKEHGEGAIGEMHSQPFEVSVANTQLNFLIAGGQDREHLYVALVNDDNNRELKRATGTGHDQYRRVFWDLSAFTGKRLKIKIVDQLTTKGGYLNFDGFNLSHPPVPELPTDSDAPAPNPATNPASAPIAPEANPTP